MFESDGILISYILPIIIIFAVAWLIQFLAVKTLRRFFQVSEHAPESMRMRSERQNTLHGLLASFVRFTIYIIAIILVISLFFETTTLIWMTGLFSAAFGLGARPLISDFLSGISFIFEDTIDVGDKVEILEIQGVVERINLRTMFIRATTGELYIVPNGEVRVIRNFSRGSFSMLQVALTIHTHNLETALSQLEILGKEAQLALPNLIEPWKILSTSDAVGQNTELTILAKTRHGKAAEARPRMLKFVQDHFAELNIELIN